MKKRTLNNALSKHDADVLDKLVRLYIYVQSTQNSDAGKEIKVLIEKVDAENNNLTNNQETF